MAHSRPMTSRVSGFDCFTRPPMKTPTALPTPAARPRIAIPDEAEPVLAGPEGQEEREEADQGA